MDAVKVAMKFYRGKEGLSLHCLNHGLSRIYRIARILSFRAFNVFGIALGFTRCSAAIVNVSSVDYFFEMLMFRSRPFNPTYGEHLP